MGGGEQKKRSREQRGRNFKVGGLDGRRGLLRMGECTTQLQACSACKPNQTLAIDSPSRGRNSTHAALVALFRRPAARRGLTGVASVPKSNYGIRQRMIDRYPTTRSLSGETQLLLFVMRGAGQALDLMASAFFYGLDGFPVTFRHIRIEDCVNQHQRR